MKLKSLRKRGQLPNPLVLEEKTLQKIEGQLNNNLPIRNLEFDKDEEKVVQGFQFLTQKPLLVILNSSETFFGQNRDILNKIELRYNAIEIAGRFEMELACLNDEEAKILMEDMGINKSARERLLQFAYRMLGYISFFTVGEDEVRAWSIHGGDTAVNAAGAIHSDLARGFIRAECFTYDELIKSGSEKRVREKVMPLPIKAVLSRDRNSSQEAPKQQLKNPFQALPSASPQILGGG